MSAAPTDERRPCGGGAQSGEDGVRIPARQVLNPLAVANGKVQNLTEPNADVQAGLDVARKLIAAGACIFLAKSDGKGGHHLPSGWQNTTPDPTVVDRWQPGDGLGMVTGVVCDVLDVDPRNGGEAEVAGMRAAGLVPRSFGRATTPSGGTHDLIPRTHERKVTGLRPGVDQLAGDDAAQGRGFGWIAPTVRLSKVTGEPVGYVWTTEPDLDVVTEHEESDEVLALADLMRAGRKPSTVAPSAAATVAPAYDDLDPAMRARVDRYIARALAGITAELRAMQAWAEGHRDTNGRGWEKGTSDAFRDAARIARARWNALTLAEARAACLDAAPTSSSWTRRDVETKWEQQSHRGEPRACS